MSEIMNVETRLLAIQSELKAPKNQYNNFGKYNYRNCEDILEAVKPLCVKHGTVLKLSDNLVQIGERYYITATATLANIEKPDDVISTTAFAREEAEKKGMDGSQVTGASSSYARKYALNALFCIDDTKDSDTTNTGDTAKRTSKPTPTAPKAEPQVCEECGAGIENDRKRDGTIWYADEIVRYGQRRYGRTLCVNCMKATEAERKNTNA